MSKDLEVHPSHYSRAFWAAVIIIAVLSLAISAIGGNNKRGLDTATVIFSTDEYVQ